MDFTNETGVVGYEIGPDEEAMIQDENGAQWLYIRRVEAKDGFRLTVSVSASEGCEYSAAFDVDKDLNMVLRSAGICRGGPPNGSWQDVADEIYKAARKKYEDA